MSSDLFPTKMDPKRGRSTWDATQNINKLSYICGFCSNNIASSRGFSANVTSGGRVYVGAYIHVCHICDQPTYFDPTGQQHPIGGFGRSFSYVPQDLAKVYSQACKCLSAECYDACVMVARRLLMVLAWRLGAKEGETFQSYVAYLIECEAIAGSMKSWVDRIREIGNASNHKIPETAQDDAKAIVRFVELLFDNVFEAVAVAGVASPFTLRSAP